MALLLVGLNHRTAPVALRERVSRADHASLLAAAVKLEGVEEAMLLSTCNRFELLLAVPLPRPPDDFLEERVLGVIAALSGVPARDLAGVLYRHHDAGAHLHLMRTAASLDSLVLGEPQILGQVKRAYEQGQAEGTVGPRLHRVMQRVLRAAKRARHECGVGRAPVSVGSIAADLARQIFSDLERCSVALIGAGEMVSQAAQKLTEAGVRSITVVNRSLARAQELAALHGYEAAPLAALPEILARADVVISSTASPERVVTAEMVRAAQAQRRYRPLFIVDIAVPRDVAPEVAEIERVYLYNIDDLAAVIAENIRCREREAARAETCLNAEIRRLAAEERVRHVGPVIRTLRERFLTTTEAEVERTVRRLGHLSPEDRDALLRMVRPLVNKLLHIPVQQLKVAVRSGEGADAVEWMHRLFGLSEPALSEDSGESVDDDGDGGAP